LFVSQEVGTSQNNLHVKG